jgi:hypothetical protein
LLWSSKLRWLSSVGNFWHIFFLYLMILFSIFFNYLSKFSKLFPSDQSISIQGCYTIVAC